MGKKCYICSIVNQITYHMDLKMFGAILNCEPEKIEKRDNFEYIPISYIETKLDEIFGVGCWSFEMQSIQVVGNELLGVCNLKVYHPILQQWITRAGTAGVQIRQVKGATISDIDSKIKNAIEMDAPHLKSDCLKNAAKTLGKVFGRDLNRKHEDTFSPIASIPDALVLIERAQTREDLTNLKESGLVDMNEMPIKKAMVSRMQTIEGTRKMIGGANENA